MFRVGGPAAQHLRRAQDGVALDAPGTETADVDRQNTVTTTSTPSIVTGAVGVSPKAAPRAISTGLVIQLLVLIVILFGATAFFLRRRRRRRERELHRQKYQDAFAIAQISSPNGLGGPAAGGYIPPTYEEAALKTPARTGAFKGDDATVMDECMRAVYDAEDALRAGGKGGLEEDRHPHHHYHHRHHDEPEPATPSDVARGGDARTSVSRWFRSQRWLPGALGGPLTSNPQQPHPHHQLPPPPPPPPTTTTPGAAALPVPPTPTYLRGDAPPATPGSAPPHTPWSASHLLAAPYADGPASARGHTPASWTTGGGDDGFSLRASIPSSVLYPSPLQPAPPPRRRSNNNNNNNISNNPFINADDVGRQQQQQQQQQQRNGRNRDSTPSLRLYRNETWRTTTPHEDPPECEPKRGDPDKVSPV